MAPDVCREHLAVTYEVVDFEHMKIQATLSFVNSGTACEAASYPWKEKSSIVLLLRVVLSVEALRYKWKGRGFHSRWGL